MTPTRIRPLPFPALVLSTLWLLVGSLAAACGSSATETTRTSPATDVTTTNTVLAVATTTVTPSEARSGFVTDVAAATPILDGLTDADLGCVADRLLADLEPAEVITLTRNGPRPDQAHLAVGALRDCDLVLRLVSMGIEQALAEDPEAPMLDVDCLLDGVTDDDLMPALEARFASGSLDLGDPTAADLLADTPMMANALRCITPALMGGDGDASPVCAGLAERLGAMMAVLLSMETEPGEEPDPFDMLSIFRATDEVFAWMVEEVPDGLRVDAVLVRDTMQRVGDLMAEALAGLEAAKAKGGEVTGDGDEGLDARMTALLGAMARIEAEFAGVRDDVDAASTRLRDWTVDACGEQSSMLFDLLAGTGAGA